MQCPQCQFENPEGSKFCLECGNRMEIRCPQCGNALPSTAKFCNECGLQVVSIDQMPAPPTKTIEAPREELTTGSTFAGRYQIIEELGLGKGHTKFGVSISAMDEWVALVNP